ncbi:MAG: hypothetical protein JNK21_06220 [Rhodospirillaceae bacterium]|nr:hypothetical protein [Rhodospirillaceae bacterium]
MITISFFEDIDGEPTDTPANRAALARHQARMGGELGAPGAAYYRPDAALLTDPQQTPRPDERADTPHLQLRLLELAA